LNARLGPSATSLSRVAEPASDDEIDAFAAALIRPDAARSREMFAALQAAGKTPDTLSLGYIAAAALRLGEWWVEDRCGFLEVTLGAARLHVLQRALRPDFAAIGRPRLVNQRALFATVPGDSHALGLTIAADFFHRAGWHIDLCSPESIDVLCARLLADHYDLVGLSAGCTAMRQSTIKTVQCLRAVRPDVKIVLGGHLTVLDPELTDALGVHPVPPDITAAPFVLQNLESTAINH
jgi:methanogenic corrinoid protein MtbC1